MATSLRPYLNNVRAAVTAAMCIRNLPCQLVRCARRRRRGCCGTRAPTGRAMRRALTRQRAPACPARQVERQNKPEVEYNVHPELMLPPARARSRCAGNPALCAAMRCLALTRLHGRR